MVDCKAESHMCHTCAIRFRISASINGESQLQNKHSSSTANKTPYKGVMHGSEFQHLSVAKAHILGTPILNTPLC